VSEGGSDADPIKRGEREPEGERRWPAALATLSALGLPWIIELSVKGWIPFLITGVGLVLLVAVIATDPGRIDRRTPLTRGLSLGLIGVLIVLALIATARLVQALLDGAPEVETARELLLLGGITWVETLLVFALLFWQLDGGGPAERLRGDERYPDWLFPQQQDPSLVPPGWRPEFGDYLYLAFTNALAFSPTDAMPVSRTAKRCMLVQASVSIVILSLVIANAVNILGNTG
jgi:uncharacterized membrane protein